MSCSLTVDMTNIHHHPDLDSTKEALIDRFVHNHKWERNEFLEVIFWF